MDLLGPQLREFWADPETHRNLRSLLRLLIVVALVIVLWMGLFHAIMAYENRSHSLVTGLYWTLTVMSTLGMGDIVFVTDLGRAFSVIVLVSGIALLFVVLPFAFIRYFYAPWTEAQLKRRAPRELPPDAEGHVVLCQYDPLARGLIARLDALKIPYVVIDGDAAEAARHTGDGVHAVHGDIDDPDTYRRIRVDAARLVVANLDDATNTSITLCVREVSRDVPIAAIAERPAASEVLEVAGATHVLPLKQQLGDQLASRVNAGRPHAHIDSHVRDLVIAEFPIKGTPLCGRTIRDTRLREVTGVNVVACWERGKLVKAHPDRTLGDDTIMLVVGTTDQVAYLDAVFVIYSSNDNPVIVIGGGEVGGSVVRALRSRDVQVVVVEIDPQREAELAANGARVVIGDARQREVLVGAGIDTAPSVVLTTHDDALNIYLAVFCRRVNPQIRIISRVTNARNVPAVHRAGVDFVLSPGSIGVKSIVSLLQNIQLVVVEEGAIDEESAGSLGLFVVPVPRSLGGVRLGDSGIGARTGLSVIALQNGDRVVPNPGAATELTSGAELLMLGTTGQRDEFKSVFSD